MVVDVLQRYGYEIHCFEDYPLAKQISIMSQTHILVGGHGAGLTNMLFMPAGGRVVELRNAQDRHNHCFFSLASELGHSYYYQLNEALTPNLQNADIHVDTEKLQEILAHVETES